VNPEYHHGVLNLPQEVSNAIGMSEMHKAHENDNAEFVNTSSESESLLAT
jgi:hypothetical protein